MWVVNAVPQFILEMNNEYFLKLRRSASVLDAYRRWAVLTCKTGIEQKG